MLKVTDGAAKALTAARSTTGAPDTHGVRFYSAPSDAPSGQTRLAFDFVAEPAPDDAVSEVSGLKTYVEPTAGEAFGDATIDVEQTASGTRLVVQPSAGMSSPN